MYNPLRTTVIQKLLEIIGIVRLCPSLQRINASAQVPIIVITGGKAEKYLEQAREHGAVAESGRIVGQFSWVTGDPIGVKGLYSVVDNALYNP